MARCTGHPPIITITLPSLPIIARHCPLNHRLSPTRHPTVRSYLCLGVDLVNTDHHYVVNCLHFQAAICYRSANKVRPSVFVNQEIILKQTLAFSNHRQPQINVKLAQAFQLMSSRCLNFSGRMVETVNSRVAS